MGTSIIGVDIGGSSIRIYVLQPDGPNLLFRRDTDVNTSPDDLSNAINDVIDRLVHPLAAIGVAVPGLVENGRVVISDVLPRISGWVPAATTKASCPMVVLNDAEAALVEASADLPAASTAAMVMVGTGIGVALLIDGKICRGARGWAGELGSMPTSPEGPLVTLDSIAAGGPLLRRLGREFDCVSSHCFAANEADRNTVERFGAALGFGLATLINIINPERIVLGGGTLRFPGYVDSALRAAQLRTLPALWEACTIQVAAESETLAARGAARRALSHLSRA